MYPTKINKIKLFEIFEMQTWNGTLQKLSSVKFLTKTYQNRFLKSNKRTFNKSKVYTVKPPLKVSSEMRLPLTTSHLFIERKTHIEITLDRTSEHRHLWKAVAGMENHSEVATESGQRHVDSINYWNLFI